MPDDDLNNVAKILAAHRTDMKLLRDALTRMSGLVVSLSDTIAAQEMALHDLERRLQKLE